MCGEGKKYDKNNSDLLARAIHLKGQNLSYFNIWLVVVCVFMFLGACVFVSLFFYVTMASTTWYYAVEVIMLKSHF